MKTDSKKRIILLGIGLIGVIIGLTTSTTILKLQSTEKKEYHYISQRKEKEESPRIQNLEPVETINPTTEPEIIEEQPTEEIKKQEITEEPTKEEVMIEPEEIEKIPVTEEIEEETPIIEESKIVYDNMTLEELSAKLDRSLNSTLAGTGNIFATYSLELGLDPYLALAIVLEETGCKWNCSSLVKNCNNVGGQKGGPSCNGGAYKSFPTLEAGIKGFLENLYNNYYALGLTTPELINPKYATSTAWSTKVNNYIAQIKAA